MFSKIRLTFIFLCFFFASGARAYGQPPSLEIWQIQGAGGGTPYVNEIVTTPQNVVTAVSADRFFIQTPAGRSDDDPATSDGIMVLTASPSFLNVGQVVTVTGKVIEAEATTAFSSSGLTVVEEDEPLPLPAPVVLSAQFPSGSASLPADLEQIESMYVSLDAIVGAPSDNDELAALYLTDNRPFREPGIAFPGQPGLPVWDGNPEVFWFDPNGLGQPNNRFLNAGMTVNAGGVIIQTESRYLLLPTEYTAAGDPVFQAVRSRNPGEITVGTLNVLRLSTDNFDYVKQLEKLAAYIVGAMGAPDILALQEVYDLNALEDLNFYIQQEDPAVDYALHLLPGFDEINLAFLTRETVQDISVSQLGRLEFFSQGGHLHDRPPLLLEANIATTPPTPVRVLNLHLRSLIGIEGSNASFVRNKRHEQSISVANMVQQLQGGDLIVLGDYNAYPFTDGYVDVYNQIKGGASGGAQLPVTNVVNPPLLDQSELLPAQERYSFVFEGNASLIDHCLTSELTGFTVTDYAFARANCDNALAYADNAFLPYRASDHDGSVLFLQPDNPLLTSTSAAAAPEPTALQFPNPFQPEKDFIRLARSGGDGGTLQLYDISGAMVWRQPVNATDRYRLPTALPAGLYLLEWRKGLHRHSRRLVIP